ncbi:MAG: hypothetical protein V3U42_08070 [candidate division NC10 bacterium]|jgi:hypothetical protein
MPRAWKLLVLLGLMAATAGVAGWSEPPRSGPPEEPQEDEAILHEIEVISELEMLQMFEILQEMEILGEMDLILLPRSQSDEGVR